MKDWRVAVVAIICIAGLQVYALHQQIDGVLYGIVIAAIAGIAGYKLPAIAKWLKRK